MATTKKETTKKENTTTRQLANMYEFFLNEGYEFKSEQESDMATLSLGIFDGNLIFRSNGTFEYIED